VEQKTYIMIKPDAVARGFVGRIISRFEEVGLTIERAELSTLTREQAAANYAEHEGKPFYDGLVAYITSGPVVKLVLSGPNAVAVCRKLMGATNPARTPSSDLRPLTGSSNLQPLSAQRPGLRAFTLLCPTRSYPYFGV